MEYEGTVYRPWPEANSLQKTILMLWCLRKTQAYLEVRRGFSEVLQRKRLVQVAAS